MGAGGGGGGEKRGWVLGGGEGRGSFLVGYIYMDLYINRFDRGLSINKKDGGRSFEGGFFSKHPLSGHYDTIHPPPPLLVFLNTGQKNFFLR